MQYILHININIDVRKYYEYKQEFNIFCAYFVLFTAYWHAYVGILIVHIIRGLAMRNIRNNMCPITKH